MQVLLQARSDLSKKHHLRRCFVVDVHLNVRLPPCASDLVLFRQARAILALLLTAVFFGACGGGGGAVPTGQTQPPSKEQEKLEFADKIPGAWKGLCIDFLDNGEARSEQRQLIIKDKEVTEILQIFDAYGCHTQVVFRDERVSSLGFPNAQPSDTDQGLAELENLSARDYDIYRQKVDMRLQGEELKTHILEMTFLEGGKEKPVPSTDVEPVAYGIFRKQI